MSTPYRHKWRKTGSTQNADWFVCENCGVCRKQYSQFKQRVVSFSRDGITYTITGTAHPFPLCVAPK